MSGVLPPSGDFVLLGDDTIHPSFGIGVDKKQDASWELPAGVKLDTSYKMPAGFTSGGGGAWSPLTSNDFPPGFYVYCTGSEGFGTRWAVEKPYSGLPFLSPVPGSPGRLIFSLGLYADNGPDPGTIPGSGQQGVAYAKVWYKPLP